MAALALFIIASVCIAVADATVMNVTIEPINPGDELGSNFGQSIASFVYTEANHCDEPSCKDEPQFFTTNTYFIGAPNYFLASLQQAPGAVLILTCGGDPASCSQGGYLLSPNPSGSYQFGSYVSATAPGGYIYVTESNFVNYGQVHVYNSDLSYAFSISPPVPQQFYIDYFGASHAFDQTPGQAAVVSGLGAILYGAPVGGVIGYVYDCSVPNCTALYAMAPSLPQYLAASSGPYAIEIAYPYVLTGMPYAGVLVWNLLTPSTCLSDSGDRPGICAPVNIIHAPPAATASGLYFGSAIVFKNPILGIAATALDAIVSQNASVVYLYNVESDLAAFKPKSANTTLVPPASVRDRTDFLRFGGSFDLISPGYNSRYINRPGMPTASITGSFAVAVGAASLAANDNGEVFWYVCPLNLGSAHCTYISSVTGDDYVFGSTVVLGSDFNSLTVFALTTEATVPAVLLSDSKVNSLMTLG